MPVFLSLYILYDGKQSLKEDFEEKINNVIAEKNHISKTIEGINANTNIAEAAQEEADKLRDELSGLVK